MPAGTHLIRFVKVGKVKDGMTECWKEAKQVYRESEKVGACMRQKRFYNW